MTPRVRRKHRAHRAGLRLWLVPIAILGGIGSAWGVMLAGIIFGCVEALITALLGSTYTQILTFGLVIVALACMPTGLFGRAAVKKV